LPAKAIYLTQMNSALGNDVHRMHDPRNITAQRQQNIQPERASETDLQEHTQWRQQNGDDDSNKVHGAAPG
jgi:hypothetical protein